MASGRLRIIGGRHRGRKLPVPDQPGLRPTGDRIRETLFNWLQPVIAGARCLDLYAGSGALGFEAASRGAAEVVMVEQSEAVAQVLEANVRLLPGSPLRVVCDEALRWLATAQGSFDVVFLDPPFGADVLAPSCALLERHGWLVPGALIYLETCANGGLPALPASWAIQRDKRAGQVRYALAVRRAPLLGAS